MKFLTVWIFGGRDVGKSTIAMHAVAELRWMGVPTSLSRDTAKFWGDAPATVSMHIFDRHPQTLTPHAAAELCRDKVNFLVLRPKYYWDNPPLFLGLQPKLVQAEWTAQDQSFEDTLRAGHVEYKTLPGVRASVQYVVKRVCDAVGYGR